MATNKTYEENTFETNTQNLGGGGSVTVEEGAFIQVGAGVAINLTEAPWKLKIDGTVQSGNSHGIVLGDSGNSKAANATVTVGTEGTVWGNGGSTVGIFAQQATDVANSGVIRGGAYGIYENPVTANTTKAVTITNSAGGLINGHTSSIYVDDAAHDLVVKNAGIIGDAVALSTDLGIQFRHSLQLTNTGDIYGTVNALDPNLSFASKVTNSGLIGNYLDPLSDAIELGNGNDVVVNNASGVIEGNLNMNGGNNTVTNAGLILIATLFGIGDDKMTNSGSAPGTIAMGDGNNTFSNSGEAGDLTLGIGDDTVTNTKSIDSIVFGNGNNKLTNSGTIELGVTAGIGDDVATSSKSIGGAVNFGDGKNTFTNSGTLGSTLTFGLGDDVVKNTGSVAGAVDVGHGNNNFTNGGSLSSTLTFGVDDDTVKNTGSIVGAVDFGNGDNTFTNSGDLGGNLTFGTGNDVMTNSAELNVFVAMGEGDNSFINTGVLNAGVSFGAGNDLYKSTTSQGTTIVMGDGNDTYIGGSGRDDVNDGNGNDSYSLGAGDDDFTYLASGTDVVDGGAGNDLFRISTSVAVGLFINLDSKGYTFDNVAVAGGSINTLAGAEVGKVKGFETVIGTKNADWLHGTSAGETLNGSSGADFYIGGGGADILQNSGDSAVDTFVYESIKDSGPTKATRDTITGFEGAGAGTGDVIDLRLIDANSKTKDDEAFSFIGPNTFFHKIAGELRTVTEGADTIIQGDVNGDGKADFSIHVVGLKTFSDPGDILL